MFTPGSGTPTGFNPNQLRQEFEAFKRHVETALAARTYVAAGNITAGGTIAPEVGTQITETVQKDIHLTADQVAIGEAGNLERDPNFEQLDGWLPYSLSDPTIYRHNGGGYNGANALSFPVNAGDEISGAWRYNPDGRFSFPVEAGGKYRVSCWVQPDKDIPAQGVVIYLRASTPDGGFWGVEVEESAQNAVPIRAGEWAKITGLVTMPENATSAFLGYFRFAHIKDTVVRFSTPSVRAALSQDLLDAEFFRGLRIVGASIETNEEPNIGVKLNDGGATAHGHANETVSTGAKIAHRVRAMLANRRSQWGVSDTDLWPGVWFESEPEEDDGRERPQWPAHVTVGDALALGVVTRSSVNDDLAGYSQSGVEPGVAYMSSNAEAATVGGPRAGSYFGLFRNRFRLNTSNASGQTLVGLEADDSDNSLRITAPGGVLVNGAPIGSGGGAASDSGWRTASYQNQWMDYGNGFGGLQYRKLNGVLYLRGTIKGGAFYTTVSRLPEGFRPVVPAGTTAMEFPIAVISGSSYIAGSMFAYANGDLTYYAPPSSWAGADRVIINTAFPL